MSTYAVQLEVEAARVAHRFPLVVPPPEGRLVGLAVGALYAIPAARRLQKDLLSQPQLPRLRYYNKV